MSDRPTTRSRTWTTQLPKGYHYTNSWAPPQTEAQHTPSTDGHMRIRLPVSSQTTTSEGHPFKRYKNARNDVGGPFDSTIKTVDFVGNPSNNLSYLAFETTAWVKRIHKGPLVPVDPSTLSYPSAAGSSDTALSQKGATAVARCSPTNPVANLSTFLGELVKDGLPAIPGIHTWEAKALALKAAGEEFLNVVFGWDPLMADIKSTAKAVRHAESVMRQFEKDAGKVVRRSYTFDTITNISDPVLYQNNQPHAGFFVDNRIPAQIGQSPNVSDITGSGKIWKTSKTVRRTWFSGAFTFYLPTGYISRQRLGRAALEANRVFGLDLTPEVLWNLAPWSWALDWVSNAGDVLKNISQHIQYGQIMRYGYIMENTISTDSYSWVQTSAPARYAGTPSVLDVVLRTETKKRRGANPFGFGLTWDGLTATQSAIAAALGLTHSRS